MQQSLPRENPELEELCFVSVFSRVKVIPDRRGPHVIRRTTGEGHTGDHVLAIAFYRYAYMGVFRLTEKAIINEFQLSFYFLLHRA